MAVRQTGTWIVLDDPLWIDAAKFRESVQSNAASIKTTLALEHLAAVKNCLKKVDDISDEMLEALN